MKSKIVFDECGGDCELCERFCAKKKGNELLVLTKKKVTKKYVPPDISAIKVLTDFANENENLFELTDEEIDIKIKEILNLIKEQKNDGSTN